MYGADHPYFTNFENSVTRNYASDTDAALGILESIKVEVKNGWFTSIKGFVAEEIFSDLLEMAEYFLDEGYKDPAAVMAGCVLEEHLRKLCDKNGLEVSIEKDGKAVPKKANLLNADLAKAGVYGKLDSKSVVAWLDLRNSAAHGKFDDYNKEQVSTMIMGITEFIARLKI